MRLKEDVMDKFEKGWTIYEIADHYCTTPEAVLKLLGLKENPF